MDSTYRQEHLSRWFFPSLLFHLLIIFLLIMFEREQQTPSPEVIFYDEQTQPVPPPQQKMAQPQPPPQDDEEVNFAINLKKSSTFGMTSMVSEETKLPGDPQATTEQIEPAEEKQTPPEQNPPEQQPEPEKNSQEAPAPQKQPTPQENPTMFPTPDGFPVAPPVQEKLPPQPTTPPEQKRKIKNFWGQAAQSSSPIQKNMSLTRLAEGFLNYTKETNDAVDINSKDLSLEPTLQKIGWFLQNSFHLNNKPIALNQDVQTNITLHLELDAKGTLLNCYLSPQTNIPALDRNLLRIAQAAAPFPPIPQHVLRNKKSFSVKIPISIDARQGTHEYYFVFRG